MPSGQAPGQLACLFYLISLNAFFTIVRLHNTGQQILGRAGRIYEVNHTMGA